MTSGKLKANCQEGNSCSLSHRVSQALVDNRIIDMVDGLYRMDEFRAAWKSDGVSTFLERINRVHDALLELSANETINAVQGAKHNL